MFRNKRRKEKKRLLEEMTKINNLIKEHESKLKDLDIKVVTNKCSMKGYSLEHADLMKNAAYLLKRRDELVLEINNL